MIIFVKIKILVSSTWSVIVSPLTLSTNLQFSCLNRLIPNAFIIYVIISASILIDAETFFQSIPVIYHSKIHQIASNVC
jgi:hypothetical protein